MQNSRKLSNRLRPTFTLARNVRTLLKGMAVQGRRSSTTLYYPESEVRDSFAWRSYGALEIQTPDQGVRRINMRGPERKCSCRIPVRVVPNHLGRGSDGASPPCGMPGSIAARHSPRQETIWRRRRGVWGRFPTDPACRTPRKQGADSV